MTPLSSGIDSGVRGQGFPEGVSVIVCAHNAASRIGQTLRHLARQQAGTVPWEIIVVDNASTDGTTDVACREWPTDTPVPLRILNEPTPGYNHAADCGIAHARFSIIAHVHDDNWLEADWIARVAAIFANPEIGACGGKNKASLEGEPPPWFSQFQENYAVGQQAESSGDITWTRGYLWGAGLCIRRNAWIQLKQRGFQFLSSGRKGGGHKLISGEDSEVCFALRLAGWKLWYSEDLLLTHFIPAARLDWLYLRRLVRSFGEASALHDCYIYPVISHALDINHIWRNAFLKSLDQLRTMYRSWPALFTRSEGNAALLRLERELGRAQELFRLRHAYAGFHRDILDAGWRTHQLAAVEAQ